MSTTNYKKFKGEIENYLNNGLHNFESKIDGAFSVAAIYTDRPDQAGHMRCWKSPKTRNDRLQK